MNIQQILEEWSWIIQGNNKKRRKSYSFGVIQSVFFIFFVGDIEKKWIHFLDNLQNKIFVALLFSYPPPGLPTAKNVPTIFLVRLSKWLLFYLLSQFLFWTAKNTLANFWVVYELWAKNCLNHNFDFPPMQSKNRWRFSPPSFRN